MVLSAYYNDQATFDGLWKYAQSHLDPKGLMHWHISATNTVAGMNSATDADEDMAWGLVLASRRWPTGTYLDDAKKVIAVMATNCVAADGLIKGGDSFGTNTRTNPSYYAPAYYRVFAKISGNTLWNTAVVSGMVA